MATVAHANPARIATWTLLLACVGAVMLLAPMRPASATDAAETERADGLPAGVAQRQTAIATELAQVHGHPWAGRYYRGDGLGMNIVVSLAPQAGVVATWHGCLGLYGAKEGRVVQAADGGLSFAFKGPDDRRSSAFPERVVPVAWGQRRYLIAPAEMQDFVNAIHHGREPRAQAHGRFLLAEGDEARPAAGLPQLPEGVQSAIRRRPLEVGVTKVEPMGSEGRGGFCTRRHRLTLDQGDANGLRPGVELRVLAPANVHATVTVRAATAGSAVGELETYGTCGNARDARAQDAPDRRWVLTTGHYDPAAANARIGRR